MQVEFLGGNFETLGLVARDLISVQRDGLSGHKVLSTNSWLDWVVIRHFLYIGCKNAKW
jgi:hypothetical protein